MTEDLIKRFDYEMAEPPCASASGRYGVRIITEEDIRQALPYLNAVLLDTRYDGESHVLVGRDERRQYAFRPQEILVAGVEETSQASGAVREAVSLVNRVWRERDAIKPSYAERKQPAVIDIYQKLPRTNCRQCGYVSCLAFAADVRVGKCRLEQCTPLSPEERAAIQGLWQ